MATMAEQLDIVMASEEDSSFMAVIFRFYFLGIQLAILFGAGLFAAFHLSVVSQYKKTYLKTASAALRGALLILTVPAFISCLFPFALYRLIILGWLKLKFGNTVILMDGSDSVWATETRNARSIINGLFYMEGDPDVQDMQRRAMNRAVTSKNQDGSRLFPKFTSYSEDMFGYSVWKEAKDFKIENHLKLMYGLKKNQVFTEKKIMDLISMLANKPFEKGMPGWELNIIPNVNVNSTTSELITEGNNENQKMYAVFFRFHHTMGDGTSALRYLLSVTAESNEVLPLDENLPQLPSMNPDFTWYDKFKHYFWAFSHVPIAMFHHFGRQDVNLIHGPQLSGEKITAWSKPVDLSSVRDIIKSIDGTTLTDVLFSASSSCLNKYFKERGTPPEKVTSLISINFPAPEKLRFSNHFSLVYFKLATATMDPVARLLATRRFNEKRRNAPELITSYWLLRTCGTMFPNFIMKNITQSSPSSIAISNMQGPQSDLLYCGNRITDIMLWIPQRASTGICVSLMTYKDKVRAGLIVDRVLIPTRTEVQELAEHWSESVSQLWQQIRSNKVSISSIYNLPRPIIDFQY